MASLLLNDGMISGLSHVTFAVSDLERSLRFYGGLLGFKTLVRRDAGAYLNAGDFWIGLTLDPGGLRGAQ